MKLSHARILVFLSNCSKMYGFAQAISLKLEMDYNYLIRMLKELRAKKYIRPIRRENRVYYELNSRAPINAAKNTLFLRGGRR